MSFQDEGYFDERPNGLNGAQPKEAKTVGIAIKLKRGNKT